MEEKIEVKEIVLNLNGKEIKLSIEDARDLSKLLKDLFGDNNNITYIPSAWYVVPPYYYTPSPYTAPYPTYPIITCGGYGGDTKTYSNWSYSIMNNFGGSGITLTLSN